jgi:hypothetical protein
MYNEDIQIDNLKDENNFNISKQKLFTHLAYLQNESREKENMMY